MALVNAFSFSHRFSCEKTLDDCCSYQQIDHTYSGESPRALCRAFYQFMMACGFAPQNVSEAMLAIGDEYNEAYVPKE
ncbi:hypothetical protein UFOVP649_99 [uncultured Caudovirales phage]|uniref:Uncharacterized protein n=1 Tax=uncultured Caudovirales phage TaxID=2100421 RepID=A0A6J5N8K3_9CAUD|nr:hypothetical protein UFOVP649_99 [uncultured Caudovirales phage]